MKVKPRIKKLPVRKPKPRVQAKVAGNRRAKVAPDSKKPLRSNSSAKLKAPTAKEPASKEPTFVMAPDIGKPIPYVDPDSGMVAGVKMATIPVMPDLERKPMPPLPHARKPVVRKLEPPTKSTLGKILAKRVGWNFVELGFRR